MTPSTPPDEDLRISPNIGFQAGLTDCYAAAPVCTPTRAAFMTRRCRHRVGLETVIAPAAATADRGLPATEPTLPRYLHDAGKQGSDLRSSRHRYVAFAERLPVAALPSS